MEINALIKKALKSNDPQALTLAYQLVSDNLATFKPRPDDLINQDQQSSFYHDKFEGVACLIGGNGSGKSYCAGAKVASFLRTTPPPEPNTPFWIGSTRIEDVGNNCWNQSLSKFILPDLIESVVWYSEKTNLPRSVVLKPHSNGNNFIINFKSYEEDREKWQGRNIIGFWLDEQINDDLFQECWGRTRNWNYPGSKIYSLTPINPDPKLEKLYTDPPDTWKFYRLNTRIAANVGHVTKQYIKQTEEIYSPEMLETRLTGAFAHFEGLVYKSFNVNTHVVEPFAIPRTWTRIGALDIGWSHFTFYLQAAKDHAGNYWIIDEYFANKTSLEDHITSIKRLWDAEPLAPKDFIYGDSAAQQVLYEFRLRGLNCVDAKKDVSAGIACVNTLLRTNTEGTPKLRIFANCTNLISNMLNYVYDSETGKPKRESANYLNDAVDALRYLCYSHQISSSSKLVTKPLKLPEKKKIINF